MAMYHHTTMYVRTDGDDTNGGSRDATTPVCTGTTGDVTVLEGRAGATLATSELLTDASAQFQTNGVQAGDFVYVYASGSAYNVGSFKVVGVNSETELEVSNIAFGDVGGVNYRVGFVFTDVNAQFQADGVVAGDVMNITSGTGVATGRFKVIAVDSETQLRLSFNPGPSGGAGDVNYKIGGAVATIGELLTGTGLHQCVAHPGDTVVIKAGTYTETLTLSFNPSAYKSGAYDGPITIAWDGTVVWDGESSRNYAIDATGSYVPYVFRAKDPSAGDICEVKNHLSHGIYWNANNQCMFKDFKSYNNGGYGFYSSRDGHFIMCCEAYSNSDGIRDYVSSATGYWVGYCKVYNNTNYGVALRSELSNVMNNLIYDNGSDGIYITYTNIKIFNNTVYSNDGHGIYLSGLQQRGAVFNNIVAGQTGASKVGIKSSTSEGCVGYMDYNCYHNNFGDIYNLAQGKGPNAVNADPAFVSPPSDLSLGSASPCINVGYPGSGCIIDAEKDIGALDYTAPAGVKCNIFSSPLIQ